MLNRLPRDAQRLPESKETESERESFPQTPFVEKGKGKENLTSSRYDEG
jgi:hypothetical protein